MGWQVDRPRAFRGISTLTALGLIAEIGDFARFSHPRELASWLGITPSEYSSGESQHRGHITKSGNRHARRLLVEAAWHYRRAPRRPSSGPQPSDRAWQAQIGLFHRHRHLTQHGKRSTVVTVAVARELAAFLWAEMTDQPTTPKNPIRPLTRASISERRGANVAAVHVEATTHRPLSTAADTLVFGVFEDEDVAEDLPGGELRALLDSGEARGRFKHVALTHAQGRRALLVGLGPRGDFDPERARVAAAVAFKRARECNARALCWAVPAGGDGSGEIAEAVVHGTMLAAYRFDRFKPTADGSSPAGPERLIVAAPADLTAAVGRAAIVGAAQNRARDLGNRPPNDLTPTELARYAAALPDGRAGLRVEVLTEPEIRALGMGAFAAVAQGSEQEARLIVLRYDGGPADARRLALIGKAVTFDSGGLWLKPTASMIEMKFDMAGGAAVIEAVAALAEMRAPVSVLGVVGATENMISGGSVRPGDIVTALDGTTVEINNTDAEGRLVLGDCITYARREGCDAIVDVATLTGGVVAALGSVYAGLMANDDDLAGLIGECAQRTGELVWRLPLHPEYAAMIRARYGQITNRTERREAMASTAAEFLHHFAGEVPWAHLDIAAVADNGRRAYLDKGGTGFGVRLLTELALSF